MDLGFTHISETVIYIQDTERSRAFYEDTLGLELVGISEGEYVFLRAGNSMLLCFVAEKSMKKQSPPAHGASGVQHFCFACHKEQYEKWKDYIKSLGIHITDEIQWKEGCNSFYFNDPDGHCVEIAQPGIWGKI